MLTHISFRPPLSWGTVSLSTCCVISSFNPHSEFSASLSVLRIHVCAVLLRTHKQTHSYIFGGSLESSLLSGGFWVFTPKFCEVAGTYEWYFVILMNLGSVSGDAMKW